VSLINTINSITAVDLDTSRPSPRSTARAPWRLLRPGGEAHRAEHGGRDRARPETRGLPISGIGGITTWRDAAEFMALGAGNVQVCTAAMTYGFKIVEEMISGLSNWMDEKGHRSLDDIVGRAVPNVTDWQFLNLNYVTKAQDRPGPLHQVRPLPHRLRGHLAPGDHEMKRTASGTSR
jgi:dihydropyrimidine dehydrogenase (NAD+) subunit PreA